MQNTNSKQKNIQEERRVPWLIYILIILAVGALGFLFFYSRSNKEPKIDREEIIRQIHQMRAEEPKIKITEEEKMEILNQIQGLRSSDSR